MHPPTDAKHLLNPSIHSCGLPVLGSFCLMRLLSLWLLTMSIILLLTCAPAAAVEDAGAGPSLQLPVRGVIRSSAQAVISTDLAARVNKVGFKEGEQFRKGDLLITFDCRREQAELASAEAQHREMMVAFKSAMFLNKRNAGSRQDVETARARADRAAAEAEAIRAGLDRCSIVAPYDGRVAELGIHEHEMSVTGKLLFSIVAEREPEVEVIVPSAWLTWLTLGTKFRFRIDETRTTHIGVVTRLGAAVDTVSQTIKVYAKFTTSIPKILPGMSGTAAFQHQGG
jgi:membrane fusion protein (multidrug efflux system)